MRPRSLTSLVVASLAPLALVVSCGGGSSAPETTIPADAGLVVKAVPTIRWDKTEYTAAAGEVKVFLANDDNVKHILVIREDDKVVGDLELVVNKRGDTDQGSIELAAGTYSVYCIVPGHGGMNSTLTVS
ncbi:MAG: hypothetical protein ACKODY_10495 [Actinomycetota bacterium]